MLNTARPTVVSGIKPQPYYVAFCNVLGFKDIIRNATDLRVLHRDYDELINEAQRLAQTYMTTSVSGQQLLFSCEFGHSHFSDTVILWSERINQHMSSDPLEMALMPNGLQSNGITTPDTLPSEIMAAADRAMDTGFFMSLLFLMTIGLKRRFPLRMGVAYGDCIMDREKAIYLGQPIVDAHQTEQCQDWIGAGVHPSCETSPRGPHLSSLICAGSRVLVDCEIPLKPCAVTTNKDVPRLALNWPLVDRLVLEPPTVESVLKAGEIEARGKKHHAKWDHAIDFYRSHSQASVQPDG